MRLGRAQVLGTYRRPETLGIVPVAYRGARVQNLLDGAAYARLLGVTDVVTHMGFIPENMSDPNYPAYVPP